MSGTTSTANHVPLYKSVVFCKSDLESSIPDMITGSSFIGMFEAIPQGWLQDTSFNDRFIRGNDTPGILGGNASHTHTYSGTTTTRNSDFTGVLHSMQDCTFIVSHNHTYSGTTVSSNNLPPYLDVLMAKSENSNASLDGKMISMFNSLPPIGWEYYNDLDGKFPRGSNAFGGTGGSSNHSHTLSGNTNNSAVGTECRDLGAISHGSVRHNHPYNFESNSATILPPYMMTIYAQRKESLDTYSINEQSVIEITNFTPSLTTVEFNNVIETQQSQPQTITILNDQTENFKISNIKLRGIESNQFLISNNTCTNIIVSNGSSCTFDIKFTPTESGLIESAIDIIFENIQHSMNPIPLTGNAIGIQESTIQINSGINDAIQLTNGTINRTSTSLYTNATTAGIGLQFNGINIPKNAVILEAYLELNAASTSTTTGAHYNIFAESSDSVSSILTNTGYILNRPRTTSETTWNDMTSWTANQSYQSPNINNVIQEIINRENWNSGNNAMIIMTGSHVVRQFKSYNNAAAQAPKLIIKYAVLE